MKDIKGLIIKNKGAMTLEAALVLPVLLCAFFTVIFLIKAVFTVEMVQHALDETAAEIASAGYIYHISGIRDMHDTARNNINDKSDLFKDQINSVFESYNSFTGLVDNIDKGIAGVPDSAELIQQAEENFGSMLNHAETAVSDPINELKAIACFIAGDSFNDAKTQLFTPVVKLYMKKYLVTDSMPDADKRLKILSISDGFAGLDFSESTFLSDRKENIDIIVKYRIDLPLPFRFTDGLVIVQRARVKAWMGGDDSQGVLKGNSTNNTDDIWSLSNFQRGLKIRRLFGANLPNSYPVIAKYENGKAVMIKSMDLDNIIFTHLSHLSSSYSFSSKDHTKPDSLILFEMILYQ